MSNIDLKGQDERAAFERYAAERGWKLSPDQNNCGIVVPERYGHPQVQRAWEVWQARAALAAAPAATQEVPDAPRYRLLWIDDIIQSGDQFIDDDTETWNEIAGWEAGMRYNPAWLKAGRRRIDASAQQDGGTAA